MQGMDYGAWPEGADSTPPPWQPSSANATGQSTAAPMDDGTTADAEHSGHTGSSGGRGSPGSAWLMPLAAGGVLYGGAETAASGCLREAPIIGGVGAGYDNS
ncbi:unnamed protein product [Urochloa humidicola]